MLVLVTWISTVAQKDQREANVSVPHAGWTTTTTEDVVVVTKIEIDSRVRSGLNYGQKKPGVIQILREERVKRDLSGSWKRVKTRPSKGEKNRDGRLVHERPAWGPEDSSTWMPASYSADETTAERLKSYLSTTADDLPTTADPSPVSVEQLTSLAPSNYLPSDLSAHEPSDSQVQDDLVRTTETRESLVSGDSCWSAVNATWNLPYTWFSGVRAFVECGDWRELAVLGSVVLIVLLSLIASIGYQCLHWAEMKKRRYFQPRQPNGVIFQRKEKGRSATRGYVPLIRTRLFKETGSAEDVEGNLLPSSPGRKIEVLQPVSKKASRARDSNRSVPVFCRSTPMDAIGVYATVRSNPRSPVLAARAYSCDLEGSTVRQMETFLPRTSDRGILGADDDDNGSYVPFPLPEPPVTIMEGLSETAGLLRGDVHEDDMGMFGTPLPSEEECG